MAEPKQEWHFPHVNPLHHPAHIKKAADCFNWMQSMWLDGQLHERTKLITTVLVKHRNLKTGQCNPSLRYLAMMAGLGESPSAERMVRRALAEAEKLGWIRRHLRGSHTTNFEFLIPKSVTPAGLATVKLQVTEKDGQWFVTQVNDGTEICGPFKTREAAETWAKNREPPAPNPDKLGGVPGQIGPFTRTPESARTTRTTNRTIPPSAEAPSAPQGNEEGRKEAPPSAAERGLATNDAPCEVADLVKSAVRGKSLKTALWERPKVNPGTLKPVDAAPPSTELKKLMTLRKNR
jgi:hypothetical protein